MPLEDDFLAKLQAARQAQAQAQPEFGPQNAPGLPTTSEITSQLAPLSTNQLQQNAATATPSLGFEKTAPQLSEDQQFISENQRPGVPLVTRASQIPSELGDIQREFGIAAGAVSPMLRLEVARRKGIESQLKYAKSKLGQDNARLSKDGRDIIVSVPNPDDPGKQIDIPLNDKDLTLGDFAALAHVIPEFAGAALGLAMARKGRPEGLKTFTTYLKDIIGGSIGQEAAGGLHEATTKLQDMEVVNPGEITKERALNVIPDTAMGLFLGGTAKLGLQGLKFAQAPFSAARTEVQTLGEAARQRLSAEFNRNLEFTAGQSSGASLPIILEEYTRSTPQGKRVIEPLFEKQAADKAFMFDALAAGGGSDEEVGRRLALRLQSTRLGVENELEAAKEGLDQRTQIAVKNILGSKNDLMTPEVGGQKLRDEFIGSRTELMAEKTKLYTARDTLPGAQESFIPTRDTEQTLKEIKAALPTRTIKNEVPTGILNARGEMGTRTETSKEPLKGFVDSELKRFINEKFDPNMTLSQMIRMRTVVNEAKASGEAVMGLTDKELGSLSHAISTDIEQGISSLPTGDLKTAHEVAQKFYKEKILPLEEAGISDLFKGPMDAGFKENWQIIERFARDPGKYQRAMKVLGPKSKGADTIRQFIKDDLLRNSTSDLDPARIDSQRFLSNLRDMRTRQPDIFNDVFGKLAGPLAEEGQLMGAAQGSMALEDVKKSLGGKGLSLQSLEFKQRKLDEMAVNQLYQAYTVGKLDINTINPEQLVRGFMTKGTRTEISNLMDAIRSDNPGLAKQIERKMTEHFLEAAGGMNATDTTIRALLENKELRPKYEAVLGPRQFKLLEDIADYLAPIRYAAETAGGTGMLIKGQEAGKFERAVTQPGKAGPKEIWDFFSKRVSALVITNPIIRNWISKVPTEFTPDLAKQIVLSAPFMNALAEDVKDSNQAAKIVVGLRQMFDFGRSAGAPAAKLQGPVDVGAFQRRLQSLRGTNQVTQSTP